MLRYVKFVIGSLESVHRVILAISAGHVETIFCIDPTAERIEFHEDPTVFTLFLDYCYDIMPTADIWPQTASLSGAAGVGASAPTSI